MSKSPYHLAVAAHSAGDDVHELLLPGRLREGPRAAWGPAAPRAAWGPAPAARPGLHSAPPRTLRRVRVRLQLPSVARVCTQSDGTRRPLRTWTEPPD